MRRAKKNANWTYRRDVFRWMGEMSVSNTPFPEEMGADAHTGNYVGLTALAEQYL